MPRRYVAPDPRVLAVRGYLEVETPLRIPAPLPEAHIEVIPSDGWVLQPSPEICMKRLLSEGYDKIFQICKCFRKAERGRRHLPEMSMLEWYAAGESYIDLMQRTEELVLHVAHGLGGGKAIVYQGSASTWLRPGAGWAWPRHSRAMDHSPWKPRWPKAASTRSWAWKSSRTSGKAGRSFSSTTRPNGVAGAPQGGRPRRGRTLRALHRRA